MSYGLLFAILVVKFIIGIPGMALNAVGLGYQSEFKIGDRTVTRPKHFNSKAHKAAFENVGHYVVNALTRDIMISFRDRDLSQDNFLRPSKVPVEVWHEVLAYFASEGLIMGRWELRLPPIDREPKRIWDYDVPFWDADGAEFAAPKDSVIGGLVPDSAQFMPSLLTEEQKAALLGTSYALSSTANLGWQKLEQRCITLTEGNFDRVYVRDRSLFTKKEIDAGVDKLVGVLAASATLRK